MRRIMAMLTSLLVLCILFSNMLPVSARAENLVDLREGEITIVNSVRYEVSQMEKAIEIFHRRYPNIAISFKTVDDPRVLNSAVMAGTAGYDIVEIQEAGMSVAGPFLYRSGCFVNLNDYPCITQQMDDYLDLWAPMRYNEDLYGVPDIIWPMAWRMNKPLMEKIGMEEPTYEWTWDDFFALCEQVKAYNAQNQTSYRVLYDGSVLPYLITQHNCNTLNVATGCANYATETYVAYLKQWVAVYQDGLINADLWEGKNDPDTLFYVERAIGYNQMQDNWYMAPPSIEGEPKYPVTAIHLAVNTNSTMKEEAVWFLSCYMSAEAVLSEPLIDCGQWLKDISRYSTAYMHITDENREMWEHNQALWVYLLENSTQYYIIGDTEKEQWKVLYPQLLAGEITAEQFVQTVERRAEYVLME